MDVVGDNFTCNYTFTKYQKNMALIAWSVTGLLSLIMSSIAVSVVLCLRLYKYFTYRLAMYQVLSSLCLSAVESSFLALLNYDDDTYHQIACKTIAFLLEYFLWIKLLFTICLVFHLFCLAVWLKNFQKLEIGYVLFSILFPLLHSWIPFIHNSYGVSGAWCWIRDWKNDCATQKYLEGIIEQFVLWFVPLFVSMTVTVVAVFIIIIVLAKRAYAHNSSENECLYESNQNKKAIKELLPLLAYPVIFYVLSLFPIIDRIYSATSINNNVGWAVAHGLSEGLWGFCSSWALIIHILVMRQLKAKKRVEMKECLVSTKRYKVKGVIYTKYTDGSTNARTKYSIPAESDIDNNI